MTLLIKLLYTLKIRHQPHAVSFRSLVNSLQPLQSPIETEQSVEQKVEVPVDEKRQNSILGYRIIFSLQLPDMPGTP
jgi:hypothetical protein